MWMSSTDSGSLLTVVEVSQALRVSLSTVYKAIESGRLPAVRVGPGAVRVDREALAAYLVAANSSRVTRHDGRR
jgi:excisionase family DNA binding protein